MKFVYAPEGAEPKSWDFNPDKLMNAEAEAIERHTGWTFGEFVEKFGNASTLAIHGLLYVLLKRSDPTLKWDSVQFCMAEIDMQIDDDEAVAAIANMRAKDAAQGLTVQERSVLDGLLAGYGESEGADPKD